MGDAADILGIKKEGKVEVIESAVSGSSKRKQRVNNKPPNISREVYALLNNGQPESDIVLPSMVPTKASGFKDRRVAGLSQKWEWVKYQNSARSDSQQFYRWHKCGLELLDYPYVRFNTKLDKVQYSEEEYDQYLSTNNPNRTDLLAKTNIVSLSSSSSTPNFNGFVDRKWGREEDDALIQIAFTYDLRWPVIFDRWSFSSRTCEELQHRYYTIAQTMVLARGSAASSGMDDINQQMEEKAMKFGVDMKHNYNLQDEMTRRSKVDALFQKPKMAQTDSRSEADIRAELRVVESELKRLRKEMNEKKESTSPRLISSETSTDEKKVVDSRRIHNFDLSTLSGRPYLMSLRLKSPVSEEEAGKGKGLKKQLIAKLDLMLQELKVPTRPLPTPAVCDAYDCLRKDIITLLSLRKLADRSVAEIQALTSRLEEAANPTAPRLNLESSSSSSSSAVATKTVGEKPKRKGGGGSGSSKKRTKK